MRTLKQFEFNKSQIWLFEACGVSVTLFWTSNLLLALACEVWALKVGRKLLWNEIMAKRGPKIACSLWLRDERDCGCFKNRVSLITIIINLPPKIYYYNDNDS